MEDRVVAQFNRIVKSIRRLTSGTPLEATTIMPSLLREGNRVGFSALAPDGAEPFSSYSGILLEGIESWDDKSLDQRLYDSSNPATRHFLNKPEIVIRESTIKRETRL